MRGRPSLGGWVIGGLVLAVIVNSFILAGLGTAPGNTTAEALPATRPLGDPGGPPPGAPPGLPPGGSGGYTGPRMPSAPSEGTVEAAGPAVRVALNERNFPGGEFMDVAYAPPYVYVTGGVVGLAAYRLSAPADPGGTVRLTPIPSSLLPGRGYRVRVVRPGLLAVSNKLEALQLVDVRQPDQPRVLSQIRSEGTSFEGLASSGSLLLAARRGLGLAAYDVRDPAAPRLAWTLTDLPAARDVAASGDLAVVAAGQDGVAVVSTAGGRPRVVGRVRTGGDARRIVLIGHYACAAMGHRGIGVVDVSRPATPRLAARIESASPIFGVAAAEGFLYAAAWSHLAVYDLAVPGRPRRVFDRRLTTAEVDASVPLVTGVAVAGPWVVASEWSSLLVGYHDRRARPRPEDLQSPTSFATQGPGEAAPDFTMADLDGRPHRLADYRGRTVLLAFFAPY